MFFDSDRAIPPPRTLPSSPILPTQTELCGGFDSFELYKLTPSCSGIPVDAYEQVRSRIQPTPSCPAVRFYPTETALPFAR